MRMELDGTERVLSGLLGIADLLARNGDRPREADAIRCLCLDLDQQLAQLRRDSEPRTDCRSSSSAVSVPSSDDSAHSGRNDMLILTRRQDQGVWIGDSTYVLIQEVDSNKVRLGIAAPEQVDIVRDELADDPGESDDESR